MIEPEYHIAFLPTKSLWRHVIKDDFTHCFIFFPYDGDMESAKFVCICEHTNSFINFGLIEKEVMLRYLSMNGQYFKVKAKRKAYNAYLWWIPKPFTCVTICKDILGIRKPFIWTPYQLCNYIRRTQWVDY